jgi:hypothetical protein
MNTKAITTLALLAGVAAQGGQPVERTVTERTVTVCMEIHDGSVVVPEAQVIATRMFSDIGVTIHWHHRCLPGDIQISLSGRATANRRPDALGYALPYEGTRIVVFHDRVEQVNRDMRARLLAHVLVHEITHILQGIDRHSSYGVMKAHWDAKDYSVIASRLLPFAPEDIHLIYLGLAQRSTWLKSNTEIAPSSAE